MTKKIYTIDQINEIAKPILKKYGVVKAYLFGSYARGDATEDSDIDFLINKGDIDDLFELSGLYLDLEDELLKKIDIVFIENLEDDRFSKNVIKERIDLFMSIIDRIYSILEYIIKYCEKIDTYILRFGDSLEDFESDDAYRNACCMCVLQIGELISKLPNEFKEEHNYIEWRKAQNIRNMYAHGYEKLDSKVAWTTIKKRIPVLHEQCLAILNNLEEPK